MFNRILVAVDRYDNSRDAFEKALFLAKITDARLMLLHVLSFTQEWQSHQDEGLELLRSLHNAAAVAGINADLAQPSGDPGETICDLARRWGAELLIVGQHNLMVLNEPSLASVSDFVTHHAPCPVLIVPNQSDVMQVLQENIAAAC